MQNHFETACRTEKTRRQDVRPHTLANCIRSKDSVRFLKARFTDRRKKTMKESRRRLKVMLIVLLMLLHVLPAGSTAQEAVSEGAARMETAVFSEAGDSAKEPSAEGVNGQNAEIPEAGAVSLSATISTGHVKVLRRAAEDEADRMPAEIPEAGAVSLSATISTGNVKVLRRAPEDEPDRMPAAAEETDLTESLSEEDDGDEAADEFGLTAISGEEQSAVGEGFFIIYSNSEAYHSYALGNDLSSVQITIENGQVTSSNDHVTWKFTEENGSYLISFEDHGVTMYLCRSSGGSALATTTDADEAFRWTYENRKLKNDQGRYIRFNGSFSLSTNGQSELTDILLARVSAPEPTAGVNAVVCKTDLGGSGGTPLSGAEFILHGQHLVSGENGRTAAVSLPLSAEPYVLTETKAPDGYMQSAPVLVTVSADGVSYTQQNVNSGNAQTAERDTNGNYIIYVRDERGTELPMTGGTGTLFYTLSGLVLIVSAALMYGFRMRHGEGRLVNRL